MTGPARRPRRTAAVVLVFGVLAAPVLAQIKFDSGALRVRGATGMVAGACPPRGHCIAVGSNQNKGQAVVADVGTKIGRISTLRGLFQLVGIACPRRSSCLAVGNGQKGGGIVPISDGHPGRVRTVPGKPVLQAIACTPTYRCVVTGFLQRRSGPQPVIVKLKGPGVTEVSVHVQQSAVVFAGGEGSNPPAPVCSSAQLCVGAGTLRGEGAVYTLAGGKVTQVHRVAGTTALGGLACPRRGHCLATGFHQTGTREKGVLVPIADGRPGRAKVVAGVNFIGPIVCRTARRCYAFGFSDKAVAIPITDGRPGRAKPAPAAIQGAGCSPVRCVAVGTRGSFPHASGVVIRFH